MFPAGFEPATLRVWGARDNHYTTETLMCDVNEIRVFEMAVWTLLPLVVSDFVNHAYIFAVFL